MEEQGVRILWPSQSKREMRLMMMMMNKNRWNAGRMVHVRATYNMRTCQREHPLGGSKETRRPRRQVP